MKREALSRDGYIINQHRTDDLPYNGRMSSENGCGWIAAYNLLRMLGTEPDADALRSDMARCAPLKGRFGTWPLRFRLYLARLLRGRGFRLAAAYRMRTALRRAEHCLGGIVLYCHAQGPHYVAFVPAGAGRFRFLNALAGREDDITDLETFLRRERAVSLQMIVFAYERPKGDG